MNKVLELNNILEEEIKFCEKFEELLLQKKDMVIHTKVSRLKEFDDQIYEAQKKLETLAQNRKSITAKFGNENLKLSDIIKNIEDKVSAQTLEEKRQKIQYSIKKITLLNKVINSLIEHSLKMIDGSISAIANAMAQSQSKGDYYNGYGEKQKQQGATLSAIIEDA